MVHDRTVRAGSAHASEREDRAVEHLEELLARMRRRLLLEAIATLLRRTKDLRQVAHARDESLLRLLVADRSEARESLLHERRRAARLRHHVEVEDLFLQVGRGGTRYVPQDVDEVPLEPPLVLCEAAVERGLERLEGRGARVGAVDLEEREEKAPRLALLLAVDGGEEPLRRESGEELEHLLQEEALLGPLEHLPETVVIELAVRGVAHERDRHRVEVLLRRDPLGELEHDDRAREGAFVHLLDRGSHHLAETRRALVRVVPERHETSHGARHARLRFLARVVRPRPVRQAAAEHAEELLDARVDPEVAELSEEELEVLAVARSARGGRDELGHQILRDRRHRFARRCGSRRGVGRRSRRTSRLETVEEDVEAPERSRDVSGRAGARRRMGRLLVGGGLAVQRLDGRRERGLPARETAGQSAMRCGHSDSR